MARAVTAVVIPIAGLSTRMLPATKVIPKSILAVVDRPVIDYAIDEVLDANIHRVLLLMNPGQEIVAQHLGPTPDLERMLVARGKSDLIEMIRPRDINLTTILQPEPLGSGNAVLMARDHAANEYFACLLPDDIFVSRPGVLARMVALHAELGCSVILVKRMPLAQISRFGSIATRQTKGPVYDVDDIVEKPDATSAPSDLAVLGRYVLSPKIFEALAQTAPGAGGEIQLTDGIRKLLSVEKVVALEHEGSYLDAGTTLGLVKATIALARLRPEFRKELDSYMADLVGSSLPALEEIERMTIGPEVS